MIVGEEMFYPHQLGAKIQDRKTRLLECGSTNFLSELRYFVQFLRGNQWTLRLLTIIDADATVDFTQWYEQARNRKSHAPYTLHVSQYFPETEAGRAKICYGFLQRCMEFKDNHELQDLAYPFHQGGDYYSPDNVMKDVNNIIVEPLVNFIIDRIEDSGNILYLIERFKMKCEWFRRDDLHNMYKSDTRHGEHNLNQELRASLFDGGIDYPFSEPSSPSGMADVVALLESDDPLVLEVKVFDPKSSKGKGHVRQGFQQILRYAQDYNQSIGYLVIFNCSDKQLVVSSEATPDTDFPPRIVYGGKTFFVIPIDVHSCVASASTERTADRRIISLEELTGA